MVQRDLQERLRAQTISARDRIAAAVRPLGPARLVERTEPGWSAAEVLEHLLVTEESYEVGVQQALRAARPDAAAPMREWRSTLLGGFIADALEKPRKIGAPKKFIPGATPRGGILEKFLAEEAAFIARLDASASLDWRAVRIKSPALPGWAPSMNLGDLFRIHAVHNTRHAAQIERIVSRFVTTR